MRPILSIILALTISVLSIIGESCLYIFSGISISYSNYLFLFSAILFLILGGIIIAWSATDKKIIFSLIYGVIFGLVHGFIYNLLFETIFIVFFILSLIFAGIGGYIGVILNKHFKIATKTKF